MRRALVSMGCLSEVDGVDQERAILPRQPQPVRQPRPRPVRQPRPERTLQQEHHCDVCGVVGHNILTCEHGTLEDRNAFYRSALSKDVREKRSLLYTQESQRDQFKVTRQRALTPRTSPRKLARTGSVERKHRTFLELALAGRRKLVEMSWEDGLFSDLQGQSCFEKECSAKLGPLWTSPAAGCDIVRDKANHKCNVCGTKFAPGHDSLIFAGCRGHGCLTRDVVILLFWLKAHAFTPTHAAILTGVSLRAINKYYDLAESVKYFDVLRREESMVFGSEQHDVDIEADEKLFGATCVLDKDLSHEDLLVVEAGNEDQRTGDPDGVRDSSDATSSPSAAHRADFVDLPADVGAVEHSNIEEATAGLPALREIVWLGLPYICVVQRGDRPGPHGRYKVWLQSMGHSMSRLKKRLPRLPPSFWQHVLQLVRLRDDARCVLHSDGGESTNNAYSRVNHPGIIAKEHVKHSVKQWARHCVLPGRRHSVTGDQLAERVWKGLKPFTTNTNKRNDVAMELSIREGQWHFILGCGADVWRMWCGAASTFRDDLKKEEARVSVAPVFAFPRHEEAAVRLLLGGDATPLRARVLAKIKESGGMRPRKRGVSSSGKHDAADSDSHDEVVEEEIRYGGHEW